MSASPLLNLPVELVEHILLSADVPAILRIAQTCRRVHIFVCVSDEIWYKVQLYFHGYVDAPRTATSLCKDRHVRLFNLRNRWLLVRPVREDVLYLCSVYYVLEGGMFVMSSQSPDRLYIARIPGPSRGIKPLSWKSPNLHFKILTFAIDPTVNLLAVFGLTDDNERFPAQIRLMTLTDCKPCPLTSFSVLGYPGFPDLRHIRESCLKLLVTGPWLGLAWREVLDRNCDRLAIWNWRLGKFRLYVECVLAFTFISDQYLLTVHQNHLSLYDLSKEYPLFNRLDPFTEPVPVYQLALPEACHAAGLHRSGPLDRASGYPFFPPPPDANTTQFIPDPALGGESSDDPHDEETAREGQEIPFYEDPSRNILAINLVHFVGHPPRITGTYGTAIIIPLQRLVDLAEELIANSAGSVIRRAAEQAGVQTGTQDKARGRTRPGLDRDRALGVLEHLMAFELVEIERQRRIDLIRTGLGVEASGVHDRTRIPHKPKRLRPSQWLKHALIFKQQTHGRTYDSRKSVVSGSRFVSTIEDVGGRRFFQLMEFNPMLVNALEKRLDSPAKRVGVHYDTVEHGHPMFRLMERNWETEGLIVPITFDDRAATSGGSRSTDESPDDDFPGIDPEQEYAYPSPVVLGPIPLLPFPIQSGADLAGINYPRPSLHGWRVAQCGEVKYAWKMVQTRRDSIVLDVSLQQDSLIYTVVRDRSPDAHVFFEVTSF